MYGLRGQLGDHLIREVQGVLVPPLHRHHHGLKGLGERPKSMVWPRKQVSPLSASLLGELRAPSKLHRNRLKPSNLRRYPLLQLPLKPPNNTYLVMPGVPTEEQLSAGSAEILTTSRNPNLFRGVD